MHEEHHVQLGGIGTSFAVNWHPSLIGYRKLTSVSQNTAKRSALRITREAELLGGELTSYHTREAVVLEANFLREHLPYFTELLAEVVAETKFTGKTTYTWIPGHIWTTIGRKTWKEMG